MQYGNIKKTAFEALLEDDQSNRALLAGRYDWKNNQSGFESSGRYTETGRAWQFPKITRSAAPQKQRYLEKPEMGRAEDFASLRAGKERFKRLCSELANKNLHSLTDRRFEEMVGEIRDAFHSVYDNIQKFRSHRGDYESLGRGLKPWDEDSIDETPPSSNEGKFTYNGATAKQIANIFRELGWSVSVSENGFKAVPQSWSCDVAFSDGDDIMEVMGNVLSEHPDDYYVKQAMNELKRVAG